MIRKIREEDIPYVIDLYKKYMFNSFLGKLTRDFLHIIFAEIISSSQGIVYVYEEDSQVGGFIVAATDAHALFQKILKRKFIALAIAVIPSLISSPGLFRNLWNSLFYFKTFPASTVSAELLFITIAPPYRERHLSKRLIEHTLTHFQNLSIHRIKVSVQKDNAPVNHILKSMGFIEIDSFMFHDNKTLVYEYSF